MERGTAEPSERRLLNVVEEMALASGIAVRLVFVMDDQHTINAFAAGFSPHEAAIIVTHGALESLNRDELQGVVAHEFSHILNGDMRLNVTLVGVIAGIVLFGSLGAAMMAGGRSDGGGENVRARFDFRVFLLGLALWIIGSIGVFAGRLIKAVIARQREFLADASAVQFTRNPDGIGNALFKIGRRGSVILERHAEELWHMCISGPVNYDFEFASLSKQPPLQVRKAQLALVGERSGAEVPAQSARFADTLKPLGGRARLPVLQLAIPTLKRLPGPEREALLDTIKAVIEADRKVTLGEFVLLTLCRSQIQKEPKRPPAVKYGSVDAVATEAAVVLSLLAHSGKGGMAPFDKGMAALAMPGRALRSPS